MHELINANEDTDFVKQIHLIETFKGAGFLSAVSLMGEIGDFFLYLFFFTKGRTTPLVKISFFKILIRWKCSILCSCVAFGSIVLFNMLLRSNDFKRLVIS